MQDRFKFRAVVKGYYYIDTPEKYEEYEPLIFLPNVDIIDCGDIGIAEDDLEIEIRKQYPNIANADVEYMLENFRDNSTGIDTYITIIPEKIYQCTGLKDKNGKLIYEGDIVEVINCRGANAIVEYNTERAKFKLNGKKFSPSALEHIRNDYFEIIGNVHENPELLEDK